MKLKPCPFCGEEPQLEKDDDNRYDIKCRNDDCVSVVELSSFYTNKTKAIKAWNKREGE